MAPNLLLKQFMNLYWLRPETAVGLTLRSRAIEPFPIKAPAVDLSCGDGIFPFVHLGGRIDESFDVFESTAKLDYAREGADIYDSYTASYQPPILIQPGFRYEVGADLKSASLQRAALLGLYERLILFDATKSIDLESNYFETVTNFASINHYPSEEPFLSECYRILRPGGMFILDIIGPNFIAFYPELERRYPPEWVGIIERRMRSIWPTMHTWKEWQQIVEKKEFKVETIRPVGTELFARMWNIGFRPLSPELIRLRNIAKRHEPDELLAIKRDWVDLLCNLAQPFLRNSNDLDDAAGFVFILRKL